MNADNKQWIKGSFFTAKDFNAKWKYLGTQTKNNVSQGFKPTGNSLSVLARFENIPLAYWDVPTLNNMVFSKGLWEMLRSSDFIKIPLESGAFWGEAFHADRDEVLIPEVANRVTDFRIDSNNLVTGDLEILDTPNGLIAYSMAQIGPIGNSSRGWGELRPMGNGLTDVTKDDYFHVCWDLVTRPAVPDAMKQIVSSIKQSRDLTNAFEHVIEENMLSERFSLIKDMMANPDKIFVMSSDKKPAEKTPEQLAKEVAKNLAEGKVVEMVGNEPDAEPSSIIFDIKDVVEVSQGVSRRLASRAKQSVKASRILNSVATS